MSKIKNSREAAFLALLHFHKDGFLEDFFTSGKIELDKKDFNLAQEIAYNTVRRLFTLEHIASKIASLRLKKREKLLLYSGLCQYFFMDKIPIFAIGNETTLLAKKYFGREKAAFFNVFFRKLSSYKPDIEQFFNVEMQEQWSSFYSYPSFFISELVRDRNIKAAKEILEVLNKKAPLMLRKREGVLEEELVHDGFFKVYKIKEIASFIEDKSVYIQNVTPLLLLEKLSKDILYPKKILDLCSAPGGKLIALHDLFPKSELFANDKSKEKIDLLKENLNKYAIKASLTIQDAKKFQRQEKFDLIILDVPCSNSGVLHKRAEARYRINEDNLQKLEEEQLSILKNAKELLARDGEIWFMTCSILKRENENILARALDIGLRVKTELTVLPSDEKDGGFGASLVL